MMREKIRSGAGKCANVAGMKEFCAVSKCRVHFNFARLPDFPRAHTSRD
jgi:hypothetical protein